MNNQSIIPFHFEGQRVRAFTDEDGKIWFVARDVAMLLGYENVSRAIRKHCKYVKLFNHTESVCLDNRTELFENGEFPPSGILIIPEADVWRLIMRSRMPKAQEIEGWVMEEVLPALSRTGTYTMPGLGLETTESHIPLGEIPPDVLKLRPFLRERYMDLTLQFARQAGIDTATDIGGLFVNVCRAMGDGYHLNVASTNAYKTTEYRKEVRRFAEERLVKKKRSRVRARDIYAHFEAWWEDEYDRVPPTMHVFGRLLSDIYPKLKRGGLVYYFNVDFKIPANIPK